MDPSLRVVALRSMDEIAAMAPAIAALNLASRRPSPFATYEFIRAFLLNDELAQPGDEILFLCAHRGEKLVGYLPLRRTTRRAFGLPFPKIELLVSRDADRPHAVARPEDEATCCAAFYRHLATRERWASVELGFQDVESRLWPVTVLPSWRFRVRQFPDLPNTMVPLPAGSIATFFKTLPSDFRSTVGRMSRRLLAAGHVETVSCHAAAARGPLLDLFVDIEQRSWKGVVNVGVARHPQRLGFFRALCAADMPLELGFDLVLLDGVPISAMVSGSFAGTWYALETAYDSAYADLSPGYLTWLLAFRHGLSLGHGAYDLQSAFSYYKSRWNGITTPTFVAQIHRIPSLPWLRGVLGDLKRAALRQPEPVAFNEIKRGAEQKPTGERPSRDRERAQAALVLAELAAAGVPMERLAGTELRAALPFSTSVGAHEPGDR